jgi:hypothetical protein
MCDLLEVVSNLTFVHSSKPTLLATRLPNDKIKTLHEVKGNTHRNLCPLLRTNEPDAATLVARPGKLLSGWLGGSGSQGTGMVGDV